VILMVAFPMMTNASKWSLAAPFVFAIPVWVFSLQQGTISDFLSTRPIQALGRWSYSIYMVHYLIRVQFPFC